MLPSRLRLARHSALFDTEKIKPLFTATATAIGGRNEHTEASDGSVKAPLSVPKAMGGRGFGLAVKLTVEDRSFSQAELAALAKRGARKDLPLLARHAGNVDVQL